MIYRLLRWFGVRYAYVRADNKLKVLRLRIRRDPFGEFVILPIGYGSRLALNPDGTTDFSIWPEWREWPTTGNDGAWHG